MSRNFEKSKLDMEQERKRSMSKSERKEEKRRNKELFINCCEKFYLPFIILIATSTMCVYYFSIDSFWMAAEGSKQLSEKYVQQQWLFNKLVHYLYSIMPWKWSTLFVTIIMVTIYMFYIEYSRDKLKGIALLALFSMCFCRSYTLRPWIISIFALLLSYKMTDYQERNIKLWQSYLCVALSSIIIANIESAYLPFLSSIIIMRIFDAVVVWHKDKKWLLHCLAFLVIHILSSMLNPYGFDSYLYIFNSISKARSAGIAEMEPMKFLSFNMLVIILSLYNVLFRYRKHSTLGEKIYCVACCILPFISVRNIIFVGIAGWKYNKLWVKSKNYWVSKEKKSVELNCFKLYMIGLIIAAVCVASSSNFLLNIQTATLSEDCIVNLSNLDMGSKKLYNNPNLGGYLEFVGIEEIIHDVRPELVEDEYFEQWFEAYDGNTIESVEKFLNSQGFDILVLTPDYMNMDNYMNQLLNNNDKYQLYWSSDDQSELIYMKK